MANRVQITPIPAVTASAAGSETMAAPNPSLCSTGLARNSWTSSVPTLVTV